MIDDKNLPGTFPGHRYWKAIQGSVDAILAPMGIRRRVVSRGTQFVNFDAWTGRAVTEFLCEFLSKHPDRAPTKTELKKILAQANGVKCPDPHIRVAKMPERVNHRVALAVIGGGYHEAWHTKYSKRDRVTLSEMQPVVDLLEELTLAGGKWDAKLRGLLTTLQHLVEDVRIERRGNEDFPGAIQPMRDLQDFILDLEVQGRAKGATIKNLTVTNNARSILLCAFRDLGLGYNTHKARTTLEYYKQAAPGAVELLAPGGLLAPMLHEAINLAAEDKMGCLRVAVKVVVALWRATQGDGEQEGDELACPKCGAGPKNLVIRAARNGEGNKVPGRAEMECKDCGFKHEFDLPDKSLDFDQNEPEEDDHEHPENEDITEDDVNGGDGFGDDRRERARDQLRDQERQKEDGSTGGYGDEEQDADGDEEQDGSEEPDSKETSRGADGDADDDPGFEDLDPLEQSRQGEEGKEEEDAAESLKDLLSSLGGGTAGDGEGAGAEDEDGESEGAGAQDEDGESEGAGAQDEDGESEGSEKRNSRRRAGKNVPNPDTEDSEGKEPSGEGDGEEEGDEGDEEDEDAEMTGEEFLEKLAEIGAGGPNLDLGQDPDSILNLAGDVLDAAEKDGHLDAIKALAHALAAQAVRDQRNLEKGEMVWNPYDPMLDEARIVRSKHKDKDLMTANDMLREVRGAVTYLRSRLRMIVRAQEMTDTTHGVRRGRDLSSRMLVDTAIDVQTGAMPSRAFQVTDAQTDTSFALAMCLDQSGSMYCRVREVAQCMMVVADAVEGIGGKTMAFGFRNGAHGDYSGSYDYENFYHRVCGVRYDVFKVWDEKFVNSKWRFAHTQASGTTPMSDGVQFGLVTLNERREGHRVLLVITDGCPDHPHEKVIARQVRLAKQAGIHVIGVGIGGGAQYVKTMFPDSVWADKVEELPKPLLKKLNELCDFQGRYRGRKAKLDGKIVRKVS